MLCCEFSDYVCYQLYACCLLLTRLDGGGPKVQNKATKRKTEENLRK